MAGEAIKGDKKWEAEQGFLRGWVAHIFHMTVAGDPFKELRASGWLSSQPVPLQLKAVVDEPWAKIPAPIGISLNALPEPAALSYFIPTEPFFQTRRRALDSVSKGLTTLETGDPVGKIFSSRYTSGLPSVPLDVRISLRERLQQYGAALSAYPG